MSFIKSVLFVVLLNLIYTESIPCNQQSLKRKYDFLLLAIQWTPGLCYASAKCGKYKEEFSIHGLWPENVKKDDHVEFCCEENLNLASLQPTTFKRHESRFAQWSASHMNNTEFWTHEWKKHGTCASSTPQLNGQQKYFSTALQLFKNLQLQRIFSDAKIAAGQLGSNSEYNLDIVKQVIKSKIGKKVQFVCRIEDSISKTPFLSEIYVCYDAKTMNVIDCPDYDKCRGRKAHFLKAQ
ncbi:extracellular ribonuclease LE-like protein [Leptotrombidium deliense]|uniref:Extracellular ribonuclease LE-like protein n=1 Tax=Leptotrombidium deliense TaxID=299467 RepID=A0A443S9L3_9ACAR|nr:extracellular ribonuclease LE-like protein [Leptotrombidium deliense]